jgi:ribosomal protein S6--L-glutamate ligase
MLYETGCKTPEIHYRGGKILNQFDAVIPRIKVLLFFTVVH